jgi:hypothetical protein
MPKVIITINSFKAGELSPYLQIRTDADYYIDGCNKAENVIIWQQGGVTRRPGTEFIYSVGLCCAGSAIVWDYDHSTSVIEPNDTGPLQIDDPAETCGPYDWTVSGTGYTLAQSTTEGFTNTLISSPTAEGDAIITVTGCDGRSIQETIRGVH